MGAGLAHGFRGKAAIAGDHPVLVLRRPNYRIERPRHLDPVLALVAELMTVEGVGDPGAAKA